MPAVKSIKVEWIDSDDLRRRAAAAGWTEEHGTSLLDYVDEYGSERSKGGFASVAKAKAWGSKNRNLDAYGAPRISVYEWPNELQRSWECERVQCLYYANPGWDEVQ